MDVRVDGFELSTQPSKAYSASPALEVVCAKDSITLIIDGSAANACANVDLFAVQSCDCVCGIGMMPIRRIVCEDVELLRGGSGVREICGSRYSGGLAT